MRQVVRLSHRTYMDTQLSKFFISRPNLLTDKLSRSSSAYTYLPSFERTGRTTITWAASVERKLTCILYRPLYFLLFCVCFG